MNNEQIAREAAEQFCEKWPSGTARQSHLTAIILSAIEKYREAWFSGQIVGDQPPATEHQTEDSVHPTSLCKTLGHKPPATDATAGFFCRICGKPAKRVPGGWADCDHEPASSQRPRKENAGEWRKAGLSFISVGAIGTHSEVSFHFMTKDDRDLCFNAHNAALAAAQETARAWFNRNIDRERNELRQQLGAEREKTQRWQVREMTAQQQLLAALAEIEAHNNNPEMVEKCGKFPVDLSALDKHDEDVSAKAWNEGWEERNKVVKPLVDALERAKSELHAVGSPVEQIVADALAKVKEGK